MSVLKITFELEPAGWAKLRFSKENVAYELDGVSDMTDPLAGLVITAIGVACHQYWSELSFDGEPTEWRLIFQSDKAAENGQSLLLTLFECRDFSGPYRPMIDGREVFSCKLMPDEFSVAVKVMAQDFLERYGVAGYREMWGESRKFPFRAVAALDATLSMADEHMPKKVDDRG